VATGCRSCCCCCLSPATAVFTQTQTETGWAEVKHTTPNCRPALCLIPFCEFICCTSYGLQKDLSAFAPLLSPSLSFSAFSVWRFFSCQAVMDGFAPLDFSVTVKCLFVWLLVRPTEGRVAHSPDPDSQWRSTFSLSLSPSSTSTSVMWFQLFRTNHCVIDSFPFLHLICVLKPCGMHHHVGTLIASCVLIVIEKS